MAAVCLKNVTPTANPAPFNSMFQFEITFECCKDIKDDLEFKIIYVGSAESENYDQELDSILVGPVPVGVSKFTFQAPPPVVSNIPSDSLVGVTVVLLSCSYKEQEFVRVGYYVHNDYTDAELQENPPEIPDHSKLGRNILTSKPCVTRFDINWD
ncbi:histone chaperone ASF1A [Sphaeroforma arctica JP610]|uniref:Histone chaperone ASF1A n=1 Tax=Sphaeroforma arctica JP610 TaxID=667725 RepID=A0A0L0FHQ7_9EUKA|nr:histone chaperone ASF1A [Sphaeroforma arctica JP610]KNC76314.1 histone chaperone ASF1A [Sphaeroforma arctica JP610]|eukprot:XP_014150216.1 histone chaperone ASF1A [Sphaeroforma arctica JP610]